MNIHENTALLDAFVDGELTSEEMISVQSHLEMTRWRSGRPSPRRTMRSCRQILRKR